MTDDLRALLVHARAVPADERADLAKRLRAEMPTGTVLVETCHRVELYGDRRALANIRPHRLPTGVQEVVGVEVARHMLRVAVGRDSAVVAEDQLLHQLRTAVHQARARRPLAVGLDRLVDLSLRAGRRARSWLPSRRRSLADAALDRVIGRRDPPSRPVLVVGAGDMARRAAQALSARGGSVLVASRTPERAAVLADEVGGRSVPFDPGQAVVDEIGGVVVALSGRWPLSAPTVAALRTAPAWLIDLSAPSALPSELGTTLGPRLVAIDDLADDGDGAGDGVPSPGFLERLDRLVEATLTEYLDWAAGEVQREAARALADKAAAAQSAELAALWQRMPALEPEQREEVEQMARHLTERLLRDPLEQLQQDADGRRADAARELFRL